MSYNNYISWGDNKYSQLSGPNSNYLGNGVYSGSIDGLVKISCGNQHVIALSSGGSVRAWGSNNYFGQQNLPNFPYPVSDITAYGNNSYFILKDGLALSCGEMRVYGAFPISGITGVRKIVAGNGFGVALKNNGTLTGWGADINSIVSTANSKTTVNSIKDIAANATTLLIYGTDNYIQQVGGVQSYLSYAQYNSVSVLYPQDYYGFLVGLNGAITGYTGTNVTGYIQNAYDYTIPSVFSSASVKYINGYGLTNLAILNKPLSSGSSYIAILSASCSGLTYNDAGFISGATIIPQ